MTMTGPLAKTTFTRLWPAVDPSVIAHWDAGLPHTHTHLAGRKSHSPAYVIDALNRAWPGPATRRT
jgi:hypothetical protein